MDGLEFLKLVWPLQGPYLLATPATFINDEQKVVNYHKHYAFNTVDAAYEAALYAANDEDNVFFCLGAVKGIPDTKGMKGVRKHENIRAIKAFWLDIDVKAGVEDAYPSQRDAAIDLKRFVKELNMPSPYVVSSGAGLHVYWPLTDELDGDKWFHYASLLKQITKAFGLKADPARTSDRSSILRVPDTMNRKPGRPALPVEVRVLGSVTNTEDFLKKIAFIASTKNLQSAPPRAKASINVAAAIAMNNEAANTYASVDVKKVLTRCPHLRWQFDNPTEVSQGQWYAALGVLRYCVSGEKACHVFSKRDTTRYSADDVDRKLVQLEQGGYKPTTCAKFEEEGSKQCAGCKWRGKVGSPITVGTMAEEAAAPKMVALVDGGKVETSLPEPPFPFKRVVDQGAVHARIVVEREVEENGNMVTYEDVVYDYDLYPYSLLYDEQAGGYVAKLKHWLPMEGWRDMTLSFGDIYDKRKVASAMGHIGVVIAGSDNIERLGTYVRAYIAALQKTAAAQYLYTQLGWKDNGTFVIPGVVITPSSTSECSISTNVSEACGGWVPAQGDLETWKAVANVYNRPECIPHQIGVLTGFAAPLMKLSGYAGAMVALVGEKGSGKTTAGDVANTVFGHRKNGEVSASDTENSLYARLGVRQNLLVTFDEATNIEGEKWSIIAYAVTHGHGKARLDRNAQLKERLNWNNLMLATSNRSPQAALGSFRADTSAEAARIFEVVVPLHSLTKEFADDTFHKLDGNFGLAGPIFIQEVMKDTEAVRERIRHWVRVFDRSAAITSGERYWSAVAATELTSLEIAIRLDLLAYDIDALFAYMVRCVHAMRMTVNENSGTPIGTLADYFNANLNSTLIVKPIQGGAGYSISMQPHAALHNRIDEGLGKAYIDRVHFRTFCHAKGVDYNQTKADLRKSGVIVDDDCKIVLGKGTHLKSAQTRCLVVDMTHATMTGVADFVKDAAPTSNVVPLPGQKVV